MSIVENKVLEYLSQTKLIILATVNEDKEPVLRVLGAFAVDGLVTYFSTNKNTAKVKQIQSNPTVSVFYQHENQEAPFFVNVAVTGKASEVTEKEELDKVIKLISDRSPNFKSRVENNEIIDTIFFRVDPKEVKVLDFSKGAGPNAVQVISVRNQPSVD
ncbi:MAG: General stress protein 26 [Pelotomaculum sp. PtaU1.Bin035]|nr:MAG: General stress protein 26 [Pelotomaculum sp. PtaU1.Bin035]